MSKATVSSRVRLEAEKDMISTLPDDVLRHILSFLPTKTSVRTSCLSTRWRYLWTSVPNLYFNTREFPSSALKFCNFVNRVLIFHYVPFIKIFKLLISRRCDYNHVNSWVFFAILRNVEELHLSISLDLERFQMPSNLFRSEKLRVLNLSSIDFNVPDSVCLPSLKAIDLKYCKWTNNLENIFLGSPVLEDFVFYGRMLDDQTLRVRSLSLKRLKIGTSAGYDSVGKGFIVDAPKLERLQLDNVLFNNYEMRNISSLVTAVVATGFNATQILRQLSGVKELFIEMVPEPFDYNSEPILPPFRNLNYLKVSRYREGWLGFPDMFRWTPNLKVFITDKIYAANINHCQSAPECLLSCLEMIEIQEFGGSAQEMEMVEYLLKNSKVLKNMTISSSLRFSRKLDLTRKLSMFTRSSSNCQFEFSRIFHRSSSRGISRWCP